LSVSADRIGEDVSRVFDHVPGHFVGPEHYREKWAYRTSTRGVPPAPGAGNRYANR